MLEIMKAFVESMFSDERFNCNRLLIAIVLSIAVFLIYAKTLTGDFIFDDRPNIRDNSHIRLTQITPKSLYEAARESPASSRPVAMISFALNYFFHEYNVVGYHLVNIFIHITNGLLLYLFISMTWRTPAMVSRDEKYKWVALFTAFIWLVHPIQSQSVSYIVQRMNSMATMFYLFSMVFYVKARFADATREKALWFGVAATCGILALGSKQIATTLPFFIFLYEWYFFQDLRWDWIKKRIPILAGVILLLVIIAFIYLGSHPLQSIGSVYRFHELTMAQRCLSQFRVVIFYISLLLWPHPSRLNLNHDFTPSVSLLQPVTTLPAMAAIMAVLVLGILLAKKQRLISFCIFWYFGNLVIESSIIGLELVFEHRNYLPSMLVVFLVVFLSFRHLKPKWITPIILLAVAAVFATWTNQRNDVWRSPLLVWKDSVEKSPHDPRTSRTLNNLGGALADYGRYAEATQYYRKALEINPNYYNAHANLGYAIARQGQLEEAVTHLQTALKINPKYYEAHTNLGVVYSLQEKYQDAIRHFKTIWALCTRCRRNTRMRFGISRLPSALSPIMQMPTTTWA
jgi:hypothetical protein